MKSPGAPSLRREVEREFWREIAKGLLSEEAAAAVGVSPAAGTRWFRERGGMPSFDLAPLAGRCLSFHEHEEIALLRAQGAGVREIGRRLDRAPSTICRELRRNAATRGGKLDYRASVAQWKADLLALRPKQARTELWCRGPRQNLGKAATSPTVRTGSGCRPGVRSRSLTG